MDKTHAIVRTYCWILLDVFSELDNSEECKSISKERKNYGKNGLGDLSYLAQTSMVLSITFFC